MNTKVAKKQNNKGFTLIELIVVIAIIAVLAAILAPQYLRYVEKSRISADQQSAKEIMNAIQTACANEDVYAELETGTNKTTVTWKGKGSKGTITPYGGDTNLGKELEATLPDVPGMKSKKWQATYGTNGWNVKINADTDNSSVKLEPDQILS